MEKTSPLVAMEWPLVHRLGRCVLALDLQDAHGDVLQTVVSIAATPFKDTNHATEHHKQVATAAQHTYDTHSQPCDTLTHLTAVSAQATDGPTRPS